MVKYAFLESILKGPELGRKRREFLTELRLNRINPQEAESNPESQYYQKSMEILRELHNIGFVELFGYYIDKWLNHKEESRNYNYLISRYPRN